MARTIYLDYNATTPVDPEVAEAMAPYLHERFGNPSSGHPYGWETRRALNAARAQVAELLGCLPDEVVFTSSGTESNNHAIKGAVWANPARKHIITSVVEHPAVIEVCRWLCAGAPGRDCRLTVLPVDGTGRVSPADLESVITDDTVIVSIMHANNEVGTLQPIPELAAIAHRSGALFHTDAAQSLGKVRVNVDELGVDLLSVAGHKLYAPKGVGALYVRGGTRIENLMQGAGHEGGRRPGTENVLEIAGLGKACEIAGRDLEGKAQKMRDLRDRLHTGIVAAVGEARARMNGHPQERLPNTLSLAFRGLRSSDILDQIRERVAVSAGSACHADAVVLSAVLKAMGVEQEWGMGTLRFSVGRFTTVEEIDEAVDVLAGAVLGLGETH